MIFGLLNKRKAPPSTKNDSPSDCASAFKKVSVGGGTAEESSVRSGSTFSSMQSYPSWRSDDSSVNDNSTSVWGDRREPTSVLPRVFGGRGQHEFVKRAMDHLKSWMPGTEKTASELARDLNRANDAISETRLPGGAAFVPVHPSDPLLEIFSYLDVDAIAVALGASYFQRLLEKKTSMMRATQECGWFVEVEKEPGSKVTMMRSVYMPERTGLMVIYATCVYIAAKFADRIKYKRLLSAILYSILDSYVSEETACDLEVRCLAKLEWRLGPVLDEIAS
jgi:hypothetical protein